MAGLAGGVGPRGHAWERKLMEGAGEYRFEIEPYTPATMPLGRLAAYLEQLAILLGEDKSVHLVRLESGSTVLVHQVDAEAIPKIEERTAAVRRGEGAPDAMRAYKGLNRLLREDNGSGVLREKGGAELIQFPGRGDEGLEFTSLMQQGELDGEVVRVGGVSERVPIAIQSGGETLVGIQATRAVAKALARHLFEPVRLYGTGRWSRTVAGDWRLERFTVDRFEALDDRPLSSVVLQLRAISGDEWGENAVGDLIAHRYGALPAQ